MASVSTRPSARFSAITRQDSSLNSGWYSPVSRLISSSKEPSAASNWKPRCSSSLTRSTTREAVASSRRAAGVRDHRALAGQLADQHLARVADLGRVDVLERARVGVDAGDVHPALVRERVLAHVGLVRRRAAG